MVSPKVPYWALYLFIIYMNDFPLAVKEAEIIMYADDTSLSKGFKTTNELKIQLIPAFSKVCEWLKFNKLSLNALNLTETE